MPGGSQGQPGPLPAVARFRTGCHWQRALSLKLLVDTGMHILQLPFSQLSEQSMGSMLTAGLATIAGLLPPRLLYVCPCAQNGLAHGCLPGLITPGWKDDAHRPRAQVWNMISHLISLISWGEINLLSQGPRGEWLDESRGTQREQPQAPWALPACLRGPMEQACKAIPTSQRRKQSRSDTDGEWPSWNPNPGLYDTKACGLHPHLITPLCKPSSCWSLSLPLPKVAKAIGGTRDHLCLKPGGGKWAGGQELTKNLAAQPRLGDGVAAGWPQTNNFHDRYCFCPLGSGGNDPDFF